MTFPFENIETLGWVPAKDIPGAVTRPVSGAELVLDQVRRLNDGMNDLVGGIQFSHTLPLALLEERISEAWLRLRFNSPLIAAEIVHDTDPEKLGHWIYQPVDLDRAKEWRERTLHFRSFPKGHLTKEFIEGFIQETIAVPLPYGGNGGLLFHCHVLLESDGGNAALLLHAAHTILDGPSLTDCLYLLLEGVIHPEKSIDSSELKWSTEAKNLVPHALELFGGTVEGWETEGLELLKNFDRVFEDERGSHTLLPPRALPQNVDHTSKVSYTFSKEETSRIIACAKSLQSTVTVMLEAAHVLATLSIHPPASRDGRTVLFPSIVALRHLMKPPWNRRETLVVTGGSIPIIALHSTVQEAVDEREKMTALMQDFRSQYNKWISSPHHIFIVPAQSAINPIRNPISNHNAEITNLGILERKLPVVWEGTTTGERLVVEDFYLGLRRSAPVLMTHAWTLGGSLTLQSQGGDIWGMELMQQFLDEIIRHVRTLVD